MKKNPGLVAEYLVQTKDLLCISYVININK